MWHGLDGLGWGWIGVGMLHMALFWILIVVCVVILIGAIRRRQPFDAMEVLKLRYAKGEISRDEFERMSRDLSGKGETS